MSWQTDASHTHIQFAVRHMMLAKVRGHFDKFNLNVDLDEANPERTSVLVDIDAASLDTRDPHRDGHLRSADFLNAETYPTLRFQSKRVEQIDAERARLIGDLTIREVTREVPLDVEFVGRSKSPWGAESLGFNAKTKINRKDWGLTWNVGLETGGWLVGDEVSIEIDAELVKQN